MGGAIEVGAAFQKKQMAGRSDFQPDGRRENSTDLLAKLEDSGFQYPWMSSLIRERLDEDPEHRGRHGRPILKASRDAFRQ
jgi:hypothetical protein